MKLKKCKLHTYTLKEKCPICGNETKEAHYKFIKNYQNNSEITKKFSSEREY